MTFLAPVPDIRIEHPAFCGILANTLLSTIPGISGAGPTPASTLLTPILDAELIVQGQITSMPVKPNTPTGCPTPASITRAMMELTHIMPVFVNAGLSGKPTVPCLDMYGSAGSDPREGDAVPAARALFERGQWAGTYLGRTSDTLVLGESVPGGTTTALCVLRALGYNALVSSSFTENPLPLKEEICRAALTRVKEAGAKDPLEIVRCTGDPMMSVAAGIAAAYPGTLILAGGTQMLAVAALLKAMGSRYLPLVATTSFVRDDKSANVKELADQIGAEMLYVNPGFNDIGHDGLARYCTGEVKEGMGAGGAIALAYLMGYQPETIRSAILRTVQKYS